MTTECKSRSPQGWEGECRVQRLLQLSLIFEAEEDIDLVASCIHTQCYGVKTEGGGGSVVHKNAASRTRKKRGFSSIT